MPRLFIRWICVAFFLTGAPASAHTGYENETEVRLYADRMEINLRATFGFAWKLLGASAPADFGEPGQRIAEPLLTEHALRLFTVTSAGSVIPPLSSRCVFELDEHVFLQTTYPRPPAWPLEIRANFLSQFDPLTNGSISFFDQTDAPYQRDIAPLASKTLFQASPVFTHDPRPQPAESPAETTTPAASPPPPRTSLPAIAIAAVLIAAILLVRHLISKRLP